MNELVIVQQRPRLSLFGLLMLAGLLAAFWKYIMVIALVLGALVSAWLFYRTRRENQELMMRQYHARQQLKADEDEATRLRADIENSLWHAGDPRGTYGLDSTDGEDAGR